MSALHLPVEFFPTFNSQQPGRADFEGSVSAAAGTLRDEIAHARVSIYHFDPLTSTTLLVAVAPATAESAVVGTRQPLDDGILGRAIRLRETQRTVNAYVDPDFILSLPGETRSELAVPIRRGESVHGVMYLEYFPPYLPAARDEEVVELVAEQLVATMEMFEPQAESSYQDEAARARRHVAASLTELARQLAFSTDPSGLRQRVVESAGKLVSCEGAALLLQHKERQMLEVAALTGSVGVELGALIPVEESIAGWVFRNGKCRISTAAQQKPEATGPLGWEPRFRDALVVPVSAGARAIGALVVVNRHDAGSYSAADVELLQSLGGYVGASESIALIRPLRQRLAESAMIAEVGRGLTGTLALVDVLALVLRAAELLLSAQCAAVSLVSRDRRHLVVEAATGVLHAERGKRILLRGSLLGWVVDTGEPLISPDLAEDPRRSPLEAFRGPGVIVPLEARGEVRGALLVARPGGALCPAADDLDMLRRLASYASIAIENAQLYEEQMETAQALRTKSQELERAYGELQQSQERLVVAEKMAALGRITAGIAHEINSPLGSVLNSLQMARTYTAEYRASAGDPEVTLEDHIAIAADLLKAVELAEGATRKVAQFVRSIKNQSRMDERAEHRSFDPAKEIDATVSLLQHELRDRSIALITELEGGLQLAGDPTQFALVLQNLLSNAIDAYDGRAGEIHVRLRSQSGKLVLEVEDAGCGIPEGIRARIFDYLFTTKDVGKGTGLGLSIVHSIVTSHFGGEIDFVTEVGAGTTFSITLDLPSAHTSPCHAST